ncbi:WHG domain-containing protein [Acetobacter sicerae]|uniref:WHG domain-containing protein n=1 Tax=Acetobacter sicerae TaxID=85325 RepID=A0ABS8VTM9_9PROT|nr:WHG domain-containing protein [Acetobacter sicerae]
MARKGKDPEALRSAITDAAEQIIIEEGFRSCSARAVTGKAGCALGSLGYLFGGLDNVILEVNARTLLEMGNFMFAEAENMSGSTQQKLEALALGYFRYARNHLNRWEALFALRWGAQEELPADYLALRDSLLDRIANLFAEDMPASEQERSVLARTMYEAVHGVVVLGLDRRLGGSHEDVEARIRLLVKRMSNKS